GSAADIIKIAMIKVDEIISKNNYKSKLILSVHDEMVLDVCKEELEEVIAIVTKSMHESANLQVELEVSTDYGDNWFNT
ncbi:MAG: DNA polymerase, partial [Erysipelotrichaceae bacterium]